MYTLTDIGYYCFGFYAVSGSEDFPMKWEGLLKEMVGHFKEGDFHQINGVLRTAHSLTKRYRHEFKSQELWKEIKIVLDTFAAPFTELFDATLQLASQHAQNPALLKVRRGANWVPTLVLP